MVGLSGSDGPSLSMAHGLGFVLPIFKEPGPGLSILGRACVLNSGSSFWELPENWSFLGCYEYSKSSIIGTMSLNFCYMTISRTFKSATNTRTFESVTNFFKNFFLHFSMILAILSILRHTCFFEKFSCTFKSSTISHYVLLNIRLIVVQQKFRPHDYHNPHNNGIYKNTSNLIIRTVYY